VLAAGWKAGAGGRTARNSHWLTACRIHGSTGLRWDQSLIPETTDQYNVFQKNIQVVNVGSDECFAG